MPRECFGLGVEVKELELYRPRFFESYCQTPALSISNKRLFTIGGYFWDKKEDKNWLLEIDSENMRPRWKIPINQSYGAVLRSNSKQLLYVLKDEANQNYVRASNSENGGEIWSKTQVSTISTVTENRSLVQAYSRPGKFDFVYRLSVIDNKTGAVVFELPQGYETSAYLDEQSDGKSIIFNRVGGRIARIDLETNKISDENDVKIFAPIQLLNVGATAVIATQEAKHRLLAYSFSERRILWSRDLRADSNIASDGKSSVFVLYDKGLESIDLKTGKTVWLIRDASQGYSALILHGNFLYGFFNRRINIIEPKTGTILSTQKVDVKASSRFGNPVLINEQVFVGNDGCKILRVALAKNNL